MAIRYTFVYAAGTGELPTLT